MMNWKLLMMGGVALLLAACSGCGRPSEPELRTDSAKALTTEECRSGISINSGRADSACAE